MNHLFCISSPFQADSARKIIEQFKLPIEKVTLLLFDNAHGRDAKRVRSSLGELYQRVHCRSIDYKTNALHRRIRFVWHEAPKGPFKVYCGDWRNKLFRFFALHPRFKGFVSMDDGTASFVIAEQVANQRGILEKTRWFHPEFISRYPLKSLCPDLLVTELKSSHLERELDSDTILFVGCCVVEKSIMEEAYYQQLLEQAAAAFPEKRWLYYPHRSEQLDRPLPASFKRVDGQLPIEQWVHSLALPPAAVVSLFSSALFNLKSDISTLKAYYIKPDSHALLQRQSDIESVYRWLERIKGFERLI